MQIRTLPAQDEPLTRLAKFNRRTITKEVQLAIDAHLDGHRAILAQAPRLSTSASKRTLRGKR